MIKERYVNSEVARLLRDKGFLQGINLQMTRHLAFYDNSGLRYDIDKWYHSLILDKISFVVAPTQSMSCDWTEEKYKIHILVRFVSKLGYVASVCDISNPDSTLYMLNTRAFPNTESVYNEALKCILTTMI